MKLSFITDEATQSFEESIDFAKRHGFSGLELRSVNDRPIDRIPYGTLRLWKEKLDENGLQVCSLAGSFYKCDNQDSAVLNQEMEKLVRLCDAADVLNCRIIRGFAFFAARQGVCPASELAPFFAAPLEMVKKRGKILALEADPSVNTTNHASLAALLKLLSHPNAGAIFDPGNDLYDPLKETPYPDGYEAVKNYLVHVHIKDAVYRNGQPECVKIGTGLVNYPALLRRLIQDGYDGWFSLETHYRKNARLTEEQMRLPQGGGFSAGGFEATAESAEALRDLLSKAEKGKEG